MSLRSVRCEDLESRGPEVEHLLGTKGVKPSRNVCLRVEPQNLSSLCCLAGSLTSSFVQLTFRSAMT